MEFRMFHLMRKSRQPAGKLSGVRPDTPPWARLHGLTDRIGDHMAWRPTVARAGAPWVCGILSANNSTILSVSSDAAGSRSASSE